MSSCWPHDRAFGGQLRALLIGRALKKIGRVTLAVVSSDTAIPEVIKKAKTEFDVEPPVQVSVRPNRGLIQR